VIAGAQTDPRPLTFARTQLDEFRALTPTDVEASAKKWLVESKRWQLMIVPNTKTAVSPATGPSSAPAP
jgi:hypothetical protein